MERTRRPYITACVVRNVYIKQHIHISGKGYNGERCVEGRQWAGKSFHELERVAGWFGSPGWVVVLLGMICMLRGIIHHTFYL